MSEAAPEKIREKEASGAARHSNGRFSKGASGNPKGRPLGASNHATAFIRDGVLSALADYEAAMELDGQAVAVRGAQGFFTKLAHEHPVEFASAVLRLIPREVVSTGRNALALAIIPPEELDAIRAEVDQAKREICERESFPAILALEPLPPNAPD